MPFKSEKQRRYMHANLPELAKRWERDYASGGIARIGYQQGGVSPLINNMGPNNMLQTGVQPHLGFQQSGADLDIWGNRQMDLENPYQDPYQSPQGLHFLKNKMGNMFTGAKNFGSGIFSNVKNKGGALAGNLMGMLMGVPGLGALLGNIRKDNPYEKFQKQMFADPDFINKFGGQGGANKDPWGKNIRSLFGNYDVREQFDKLVGSKIGQNYGYEQAMADGEITEEEIAAMMGEGLAGGKFKGGLKGWQLNRLKGLYDARNQATAYHKKINDARALQIKQKEDKKRHDRLIRNYSGPKDVHSSNPNIQKTGPTYGPHGGQHSATHQAPGGGGYGPHSSGGAHGGKNYGPHSKAKGGLISLWPR